MLSNDLISNALRRLDPATIHAYQVSILGAHEILEPTDSLTLSATPKQDFFFTTEKRIPRSKSKLASDLFRESLFSGKTRAKAGWVRR
jgi:hypothetical protein